MHSKIFRSSGTTRDGGSFSSETIQAVWEKGVVVQGYDSQYVRKDRCGAWMQRDQYGETSDLGWEIDHIFPVSRGGSDELHNLQPLYWRNNRGKGSDYPNWNCTYPKNS